VVEMRPRIYEIIEIEDYKDNDKNLIRLPWFNLSITYGKVCYAGYGGEEGNSR
jgi:hypothetical protein